MPVQIGAKPDHGFDEPLGLLSDCHRRIERFLDVMIQVLDRTGGQELSAEQREAVEASLRYFAVAAPRHTQDEEQSLFPRMRESSDPSVHAALAAIDALEADHRRADTLHAQVNDLCRQWLDVGPLAPPRIDELRRLLRELRDTYSRHIAIEDEQVFPLAGQVLDQAALTQVGQEMAQRRGLPKPSPNTNSQE